MKRWGLGLSAIALVVALALANAARVGLREPLPSYLSGDLRRAVRDWLAQHPAYALMVEADCACSEDLQEIRTLSQGVWRAQPDYQPYFATGDFDGDGKSDAALAVTKDRRSLQVLILHGPSARHPYLSPVFQRRDMLFFGAPRPRPWRLVIGPYATDAGAILVPKPGWSYGVEYADCC